MASQKYLKDILEEDQEPFQLQSYISDRRYQINAPVTHLQVKKRRPISQNVRLPSSFCHNACFFSLRESPVSNKSPLFQLKAQNQCQNVIFVNILEAAVRIQKQSSEGSKTRTQNAGNSFGIFGSILKKLTHWNKREKDGSRVSSFVPFVRKTVPRKSKRKEEKVSSAQTLKITSETQLSRRSSSCSGVCESPFHFVLQTMSSKADFKTPNLTSPAATPRHDCQEMKKENDEVEKLEMKEKEEEEEEDKEQSSPVSVLDPPFQDDEEEDIHMNDNNISSRQKTKHLLLQKLCKFEQLPNLELEKTEEKDNKALISDLAAEELQKSIQAEADIVVKKICERLRSRRDVECNRIDMMVERDFRTERFGSWRSKNDTEVAETLLDIEFEIFVDLVDELLL